MSQRVLAEAVSQYVDQLDVRDEEYLSIFGSYRRELEPLLGVIRLLRAILLPVDPSPEFVAALRARLATTPSAELYAEPPSNHGRLLFGAAVASVVSAAAIYFVFARGRARAA